MWQNYSQRDIMPSIVMIAENLLALLGLLMDMIILMMKRIAMIALSR